MEPLRFILIVYGIEAIVVVALISWCRYCERKYGREKK